MTTHTASPARTYEDHFGPAIFRPLRRLLLDVARPEPMESVLDIACGTGIVTRKAAAMVDPGHVVGVDLNPGMIEVAREVATAHGLDITWQVGDATALDLPDTTFDLVSCQQGLQFFPDRPGALREMHRVLRPGGRAALAVWRGLDHHPLFAALAAAQGPRLASFGVEATDEDLTAPFSLGEPDEVATLLGDAGFHDIELSQDHIVARFAHPDRFVALLSQAYQAVVPRFAADPDGFARFVDAVAHDVSDLVADHADGDHVAVPMHTTLALAHR